MLILLFSCVPREETAKPDRLDDTAVDTHTGEAGDTAGDSGGDTAGSGACGVPASERRWCASCAELLAQHPDTPDGPVTLQTWASGDPYDTYCEMDLAGGGWTLAATNGWGGGWTQESVLTETLIGAASRTIDYKGPAFVGTPFADLLFENDVEYAAYADVGDHTAAYLTFQDAVPLDNCGIDTAYVWPMSEGTLADPDLCETALYIHVKDWEGGLIPCGDAESARGPAWSTQNKDLGCPLNDPRSSSFTLDEYDYNPWGDHVPEVVNLPLRMWVR